MDLREDRAPFVRDFARQIKKVRVVSSFDEKEAGAKAVKRQKVSLGLAPTEKLPRPFRVVLFEKNLKKKKKDCVLCSFSSFEEARKGEKIENFLHPCLVGVGDDGHIGSLYPNRDEILKKDQWVVGVNMKTPSGISLTLPTSQKDCSRGRWTKRQIPQRQSRGYETRH
jgi:hypothetical protein